MGCGIVKNMPTRDIPIRQRGLRSHNLAVVLHQIAACREGVSRATIAARSGLTKATVSAIVDELVAGGLVSFHPCAAGAVGRPAPGVTLAGARPVGLGMEINVDYVAACLLDLSGEVRHRSRGALPNPPPPSPSPSSPPSSSPEAAFALLASLAANACAAADSQRLTIARGVVALPGLVEGTLVRIAPNLGWHDVALPVSLAGVPVSYGNEANLAALGELHATGLPSFLYVSGEIGIGAGIIMNKEVLPGTRGWAGELGHVTVDPGGRQCRCGSQGCLEQYAGKEHIEEPAEAGAALGVALSSSINLLDLPVIVLGGHLAPLAGLLAPHITAQLRRRVLTAKWSAPMIRPSTLGPDAAVIGAARTVTQAIIDDPADYLTSSRA
jgi:predicted NBD/HSP70 family sugar kinase